MNETVLRTFDESLGRCNADPRFVDRFYERFLASSPKVKQKFAKTDFVRQKRALKASLHLMLLAAEDEEEGPDRYLRDLAARHSRSQLDIGAELYDYWLDSLLGAVRECDPQWSPEIGRAWQDVMGLGISYLLKHYHDPPQRTFWD